MEDDLILILYDAACDANIGFVDRLLKNNKKLIKCKYENKKSYKIDGGILHEIFINETLLGFIFDSFDTFDFFDLEEVDFEEMEMEEIRDPIAISTPVLEILNKLKKDWTIFAMIKHHVMDQREEAARQPLFYEIEYGMRKEEYELRVSEILNLIRKHQKNVLLNIFVKKVKFVIKMKSFVKKFLENYYKYDGKGYLKARGRFENSRSKLMF